MTAEYEPEIYSIITALLADGTLRHSGHSHAPAYRSRGRARADRFGAAEPETVRFYHGRHLGAGAGCEQPCVARDCQ
jgi:hypothetical protein